MTNEDLRALKQQIAPEEGWRGHLYDDKTGRTITRGSMVNGHPTIGVGHNLDAAPLCVEAIDVQFEHDLQVTVNATLKELPWVISLPATAQRVVYDVAYNAGVGGLLQFGRMLSALKANDYEQAAQEVSTAAGLSPARRNNLAELLRLA